MLLDPGFRQEDFARLKADAVNFLKVSLREGNDEELGKEYLYNIIYAGHPYGHHNMGTLAALERLTLDDVRAFYKQNYTRANLVVGLAGGYPRGLPEDRRGEFREAPGGRGLEEELRGAEGRARHARRDRQARDARHRHFARLPHRGQPLAQGLARARARRLLPRPAPLLA